MSKYADLIDRMTLEEKASLCSGENFWNLKGVERLGIPSIMVTDGPHGLRKQAGSADHVGLNESVPATCFPTASALASTWNRELIFKVGEALAEECLQEHVAVILGPSVNIKRSPLCGRNFEYFSEDPYLDGQMASRHIQGVQSKGIGTSLKHYAVNNQEERRMSIDAVVDERTLREIYLTGFEIAVKEAQPYTVMCSYNRINGTYGSEHPYLLTEILKKEWGHRGLVVTDWGAVKDRVAGLLAGLELEMPGSMGVNDARIVAAVKDGRVSMEVLDRAVDLLLDLIFKTTEALKASAPYDVEAHHALARKVAGEGAVLLKNEGDLLPLASSAKVALIGEFAKSPRYQGGGSSHMKPTRLDTLYEEVSKLLDDPTQLSYARGYDVKKDVVDGALLQEAVETAKAAEVVVLCVGLIDSYESEGYDRTHMRMPKNHAALIDAVAKVNSNVVVVLSNGSPIEMPWLENVSSVLEGYLGGQAGAGGLADILFGKVNPSGKLAETIPIRLEDVPCYEYFPGGPKTVEYREGIYAGYRYYDTANVPVRFPFGFGLSYTTFEYSDLKLSAGAIRDDETLTLTFKVKNIGKVAGKETAQVYVKDRESSIFRPKKELKGFDKVELAPGEETEVSLTLDKRSFAYYDVDRKDWVVETGVFDILVGASSADVRLNGSVEVQSSVEVNVTAARKEALKVYYHPTAKFEVDAASFKALLGRPLPRMEYTPEDPITISTPLGDIQRTFWGKKVYGQIMKSVLKNSPFGGGEDDGMSTMLERMMAEMPLINMGMFSNGAMSEEMVEGLADIANGKIFKGIAKVRRAQKKGAA